VRIPAGILLGLALAAPATGQDAPVRAYDCVRTLLPVTIDGRLDEEAWLSAPWSEDFTDILGAAGPTPALRTRLKLLWDETCLYVGAELEEPHLWATLAERDAVIYHEHDFELFLDPDGDGRLYAELEINALGTVWDLLLVRPYRDGGPPINGWDIHGLQAAVGLEGTLNDPRDRDRGWSIELALPWAALAELAPRRRPPRAGEVWRMNFSRVEWPLEVREGSYVKRTDPATGRPLRESNWVWSPMRKVDMHEPEYWGRVTFRDPPTGRP
jgi:hypothetical protein